MTITVALNHRTTYSYDRLIELAPHVVRLRPAPHARTPIKGYSLNVAPDDHFINWQQDAFANWQARLVFPERARLLEVTVDLIVDMVAFNPFDFFLADGFEKVPFEYDPALKHDLEPYLRRLDTGKTFKKFVKSVPKPHGRTIDWLVELNAWLRSQVDYTVRMEPGVQTPDDTIKKALGSCRDSAWLLVGILRHLGYAARFVSGYLIQLTADIKPVEGPSGPAEDFTDLHAWTEVYLPGAGWVGLDPTSGLFAGEGHIPLAATPEPSSAAPITGAHGKAKVDFDFDMSVTRIAEPPRVTRPLTPQQWAEIDRAGEKIEAKLQSQDMRLTMGGEPTFVSATDRDAAEWNTDAVGPTKHAFADDLVRRLKRRFAPKGMIHHGQGKWYPGEPLPRWAYSVIWRGDGVPLWNNTDLIAGEYDDVADADSATAFTEALVRNLGLDPDYAQPVFEDPVEIMSLEAGLPDGETIEDNKLDDPQERLRLMRMAEQGLSKPTGYVIPIQLAQAKATGRRRFSWASEKWETKRGRLFLMPGDSPAGYRLPLGTLGRVRPEDERTFQRDPMARVRALRPRIRTQVVPGAPVGSSGPLGPGPVPEEPMIEEIVEDVEEYEFHDIETSDDWVEGGATFWVPGMPIRTAMAIEVREGFLYVFMPPTGSIDEYIDLAEAVEETAEELGLELRIEGYEPPRDPRVNVIRVTPDPGVIEVNIHPASSWSDMKAIQDALYEEARQGGLDSFTFMIDGRLTGSGGGNHIVVGGATAADSPFLRRPDMLASVIRYWQRHPSLSYLFSGTFIGPTSQAPRFDEGRVEALYEMEIALAEMERMQAEGQAFPWLADRIFRNLLTDLTGNTHRSEICIDKMFSPDGPAGRLGLVEFRGFEMPPHYQMAMAQALVLRALLSWFWETPYREPLEPWGRGLHDRFLLPSHVWDDFHTVLGDLSKAHGFVFEPDWFQAQFEFRFPRAGKTEVDGIGIEVRNGIEPWLVLGEEAGAFGTSRYVDSSVERVEVKITGDLGERYKLTCNQIEVPLTRRADGSQTAGIRFRSWQPWSSLHPTVPAHAPLVFDIYDRNLGRSVGGCAYHVAHRGGRAHDVRPINDLEAEGRRSVRFIEGQHSPMPFDPIRPRTWGGQAETLDLRFI